MESVRARSCNFAQVHATAKTLSPAGILQETPCISMRSSFCGLHLQRGTKDAGGLGERALRRENLLRIRSECMGPQTRTLEMQVEPIVEGPAMMVAKVVNGAQEEEMHSKIRGLIRRIDQVRDGWEGNAYLGAQPSREVKERADGLLHRLVTLQRFAEQHTGPDGGVPVQVTATMKALSRELGSLENFVRLANESGATVTRSKGRSKSDVSSSISSKPSLPLVAAESHRKLEQPVRMQLLQEEAIKSGQESKGRGSNGSTQGDIASVAGSDYVVSAPAGKGQSPLAAFREEIERRVLEQLSSSRKVDKDLATDVQGGALQSLLWREQDDWAWSGESILDTGLADRRKAEFDLGPSETSRIESSFSASTSGSDTWKHQQYVKGTEILRQQKMNAMEDEVRTAESERLRLELHHMQAELMSAESNTARARVKELELKVRQLELDLSRSVPLTVHDQVVKKLHGSIAELRGRIRELEGSVRERESMITTVSNNLIAERDAIVKKLTTDLAMRVPREEMERAVTSAVDCVRAELSHAQQEVRLLAAVLDQREEQLEQQVHAREEEKRAAKHELDTSVERVVAIEDERRAEMLQERRLEGLERTLTQVREERDAVLAGAAAEKEGLLQKVVLLERSLAGSTRQKPESPDPTPGHAAAVSELKAELLSARQAAAQDKTLLERVRYELKELTRLAEAGQFGPLVQRVAGLLVSISREEVAGGKGGVEVPVQAAEMVPHGGGSVAGAAFTAERRKVSVLESRGPAADCWTGGSTDASPVRAADSDDEEYLSDDEYETEEEDDMASSVENIGSWNTAGPPSPAEGGPAPDKAAGDAPKITLRYETGWDKTFMHCSVDGQSWTELPGLPMEDGSGPEGQPVKVLGITATCLEFVLTNGADDWDKPAHGGNYRIDHAGTYTLSSGHVEEC